MFLAEGRVLFDAEGSARDGKRTFGQFRICCILCRSEPAFHTKTTYALKLLRAFHEINQNYCLSIFYFFLILPKSTLRPDLYYGNLRSILTNALGALQPTAFILVLNIAISSLVGSSSSSRRSAAHTFELSRARPQDVLHADVSKCPTSVGKHY